MDDIVALLRSHVSIREYTPEPIPDATWDAILGAGQAASTDATGQLYSAVEVRPGPLRETIGRLAGDQAHVHSAARFLVVALDVRRLRLLLEHRGERFGMEPAIGLLFGITDAACFAQNLCVAAEGLGYGVCYIGAVQNEGQQIADALGMPEGVVPLWGITFGRPARRTPPKPRLPRATVVHVDRYRDPSAAEMGASYETMRPATRSGDWLNPIKKYFAEGGVMSQREEGFRALLQRQGLGLEKR